MGTDSARTYEARAARYLNLTAPPTTRDTRSVAVTWFSAPTGPVPIKGLVVSHGSSLYGSVYWDSSSEVYDYFFSYNGNGYSEHSRTDESPDNSTAEVISERPDNPPTELSDFQTVSVENATSAWSSGSAGFVSNPHHYGITMEDTSGIVLADTSNLDSQSNFTNTWAYCS